MGFCAGFRRVAKLLAAPPPTHYAHAPEDEEAPSWTPTSGDKSSKSGASIDTRALTPGADACSSTLDTSGPSALFSESKVGVGSSTSVTSDCCGNRERPGGGGGDHDKRGEGLRGGERERLGGGPGSTTHLVLPLRSW